MKTIDIFEKLKKEYREITPRKTFRKQGWEELQSLLDKQETTLSWSTPLFKWASVAVILFFISSTGVLAFATQAKPGDTLYGVKKISERFVASITPRPTIIKQQLPLEKTIIKQPTQSIPPTFGENVASQSGEDTKQKDDQDKKEEEQKTKKND